MTPELRASIAADNSMDRVNAATTATLAATRLQTEVNSAQSSMTAADYGKYWSTLKTELAPRAEDLSVGFAEANFARLDKDGSGTLERSELDPGEAKTDLERSMLGALSERFDNLRGRTKTGAFWNLYQLDPDGITREDLGAAMKFADIRQKNYNANPLLPGTASDTTAADIPSSVRELLGARGITVKSVPGRLRDSLKAYAEEAPIVLFASAMYTPETREIIAERGPNAQEAKQHEIGHAIDDALAPGDKYFTDSREFNIAMDDDMRAIKALPYKIDWIKELPTGHVFVQGQLTNGDLRTSGRREIFADLYQSKNSKLADQLRRFFPRTAASIDTRLAVEGLDRFSQ